jgi:hypothetical protein
VADKAQPSAPLRENGIEEDEMSDTANFSYENWSQQPQVALWIEGKPVDAAGVETSATQVVHRFDGGLCAVGTKTVSPDAVEWAWRLENRGATATPRVTAFNPLRLTLPCQGRHAPVLHGSRGGLDDANFPPEAWTQWNRAPVTEGMPWAGFRASSAGGRSSNRDLPFFVIEETDRQGGFFLGIGWSGDWHLEMRRTEEEILIVGGMTNLNLSLRPGEAFRQPTILLGRFRGDAAAGQRALRQYLRDHVQPKLDGRPVPLMSFWNSYYGDRGHFFEQDALAEIPLAAKAGFEYFIVDAGWTGGGEDHNFFSLLPHTGSWEVAPSKFPRGLEPIRAAAAREGIKLGLWFDIERAHRDSQVAREHPELVHPNCEWLGCNLLRLQDPRARDWAVETISRHVRALDLRWIRFDFNSDPAGAWAEQDAEGRRGETEIRYLENLYALLDTLRERFPSLAIENCASGGRRIDLETLRRSHTDWISDHSQSEAVVRYHLHGACRWLPANRLNTTMAHAHLEPNRPVDWREPLPASAYLSLFGGNFSVSDRLLPLMPAAQATLRRYLELFRQTAPCFAGEAHPFGSQADTLAGPAGIAALDPATGRRAVVFFGPSPEAAAACVPAEFRSLVAGKPVAGDAGTDQFVGAWLWRTAEAS